MSIFDNKELINSLINAGVDFNKKFAAPDTPATVDPAYDREKQVFQLAQALGTNMQRSLKDPEAAAKIVPISTESGSPANFTMADGRTLGHFLEWAARNQVKWNGKRIAWLSTDTSKPQDAWTFESLDADLNKRDSSGQPVKKLAYADKDALIGYLIYLRDAAVPGSKDSKPFEIVVKNLIGELNRSLPKEQQQQVKVSPEGKTPEIDPNLVVDAFPDSIFMPDANGKDTRGLSSVPDFRDTPIKLTMGNLENLGAFTRWLYGMQIRKPNNTKAFDVMDPNEGDPCAAVRILYNRAMMLSGVASAHVERQPQYEKMAARYLQAIKEFGPQLRDPRTQANCSLTGVTGTDGTGATGATGATGETGTGTGGAGELNADQRRALSSLLNSLPLEPNAINFTKIQQFMKSYANFDTSIAGGGGSMGIRAAGDALKIIDILQHQIMNNAYPYINLTQNAQLTSQALKSGFSGMMDFCDNLRQLISTTSNVIGALYGTYGYIIDTNPKFKTAINQQLQQFTRDNTASIGRWQFATQQKLSGSR